MVLWLVVRISGGLEFVVAALGVGLTSIRLSSCMVVRLVYLLFRWWLVWLG